VSWAIGIDFGTSRSAGAIGQLDHRRGPASSGLDLMAPLVSALEIEGNRWVPSMVLRTADGQLVTGAAADNLSGVHPDRLERTPKRALGGVAPLLLGGVAVDPRDASAAVIAMVAAEGRLRAGEDPVGCIVTHPVRWADVRREALRDAAHRAGLRNVQLVEEPVAAAIHYASEHVHMGAYVGVYDLGGGTFDTALLQRTEAGFEVVGVPGGDEHVGGENFDHRLFRHFGSVIAESDSALWEQIITSDDRKWKRAALDLLAQARRAKEALSSYTSTQVFVPIADRDIVIHRHEFEAMIIDDIERTVDLMEETIVDAGLKTDDLAAVFLVGGSSRIPLVVQQVTERFGARVITRDEPKGVVALGAARLGALRFLDGPTGANGVKAGAMPTSAVPTSNASTAAVATSAAERSDPNAVSPSEDAKVQSSLMAAPLEVPRHDLDGSPVVSPTAGLSPNSPAPNRAAPSSPTPTAAAPNSPTPTAGAPSSPAPRSAVPTTAVPTTAVPTTAVPTTAVPTTAVPTTAVPRSASSASLAPSPSPGAQSSNPVVLSGSPQAPPPGVGPLGASLSPPGSFAPPQATSVAQHLWQLNIGESPGQLVADEAGVVCASQSGTVRLVDARSGTLRWTFKLATRTWCRPLLTAHYVAIGDYDGRFYVIDRATGTLRWSQPTGAPVMCAPIAIGESLCMGSDGSRMIGFDAKNGATRWVLPVGAAIRADLVAANNEVVVATTSGQLYAVDHNTGRPRWGYRTGGSILHCVALSEGRLVIASQDNTVCAVAIADGRALFSLAYPAPTATAVVVSGDVAAWVDQKGWLRTLRISTGQLLSEINMGTTSSSGVVLCPASAPTVAVVEIGHGLMAIDLASSSQRFSVATGQGNRCVPILHASVLYAGTTAGQLLAIAAP
jgi:outer membrane protein assembly factor BamB